MASPLCSASNAHPDSRRTAYALGEAMHGDDDGLHALLEGRDRVLEIEDVLPEVEAAPRHVGALGPLDKRLGGVLEVESGGEKLVIGRGEDDGADVGVGRGRGGQTLQLCAMSIAPMEGRCEVGRASRQNGS